MKRARPKLVLPVLEAKGVRGSKKRKAENDKCPEEKQIEKGSAMCWYALGMRRACAKVCDKPLSKMCEASAPETNATSSGSEGRLRKEKSEAEKK